MFYVVKCSLLVRSLFRTTKINGFFETGGRGSIPGKDRDFYFGHHMQTGSGNHSTSVHWTPGVASVQGGRSVKAAIHFDSFSRTLSSRTSKYPVRLHGQVPITSRTWRSTYRETGLYFTFLQSPGEQDTFLPYPYQFLNHPTVRRYIVRATHTVIK
jgi:hypothetical protein